MKRYVAYTSDVEPEPDGPYVDERQNSVHVYLARDVDAILRDARTVAEWHQEDGDECGVIARRLLAALADSE